MELDSSVARCQIYIDAINKTIQERRLTAEGIHEILLAEIQQELQKPEQEINFAYIEACEQVIDSLYRPERKEYVSSYEMNWKQIEKSLERRTRPTAHLRINIDRWRIPVAVCCSVLIMCMGLIVPKGWIFTYQTEDEGQYIMQGIQTPDGMTSVAEAGPSSECMGLHCVSDWQSVVRILGGVPPVPQWLPTEWYIEQYTIGVMETASSLTISYVHEGTRECMTYTYYAFFDYNLHMAVEQNEEGTYITLDNGTTVYLVSNVNKTTVSWYTDCSEYMISGNISEKLLLRIAESVE